MWFNLVPTAPIPAYKRSWFQSAEFRRSISDAINREDLAKVAFLGHAEPAYGLVSPSNKFWFNTSLPAPKYDRDAALSRLIKAGSHLENGALRDAQGNAVEFSIVTNSGNRYRERMATMIQQDLAAIGVKINVVTLDFPSLIERFTQSFNYEAAILGFTNVDLDPNSEMAIWLSSGENHAWNPKQEKPQTAWEGEIDRLMREQASVNDLQRRKVAFDRVQQIVYEQAPMLFLVNKNALSAVSPSLSGVVPVVLRPQIYWNADQLHLNAGIAKESR
jgi:peptide/nickel transport system substrate-binding protein